MHKHTNIIEMHSSFSLSLCVYVGSVQISLFLSLSLLAVFVFLVLLSIQAFDGYLFDQHMRYDGKLPIFDAINFVFNNA